MAGIGFALSKILNEDSILGVMRAYGYAAVIGSAPWVLSTLGMVIIGTLSVSLGLNHLDMIRFLVSVAYLMAVSLLITGGVQLMLTRFLADRIFENHPEEVLPNTLGAVFVMMIFCFVIFLGVRLLFFEESMVYQLLMLVNLVVLSTIWLLVVVSSGLPIHRLIVGVFFIGYSVTVIAATWLSGYELNGLLLGFFIGHSVLLFCLLVICFRYYPSPYILRFDFLVIGKSFYSLAIIGAVYSVGAWADKIIFWMNPETSELIVGALRTSVLYDPPIFLAYLFSIPGMAVLLLRMEVSFAQGCRDYYDSIRYDQCLDVIFGKKRVMERLVRHSFYEIIKVQGIVAIFLILFSDKVVVWFGLSENYRTIFMVDVFSVMVQILFLALMNVFFYMDKRVVLLKLTLFFAVSNIFFTLLSQWLGPYFYGYGFAVAMILTMVFGLFLLISTFGRLEYETFMLQK